MLIQELDIVEVNDVDYTMTLKLVLGVRWKEKRIIYRGNSDKNTINKFKKPKKAQTIRKCMRRHQKKCKTINNGKIP